MAISLKDLKTTTAVLPPRIIFYSPHGMGKTTLANEFPDTVFLQTEQGEGTDMEINTFGLLNSYEQIVEAIGSLYAEDHPFKTVCLDSVDKLEPLLWRALCDEFKWASIESPGYGKGYIEADRYWRELLDGLNALRRERGMSFILIAHSEVERFDDPRTSSYSRYDIRLHKRARAILQDEVDFIGFINQEAGIKEEDTGFNKKRAHAEGSDQRWIYTVQRPSFNAKNRYGIPAKVMYRKGQGYTALAPYFPNTAEYVAPAIQPEQTETAQGEPAKAAA